MSRQLSRLATGAAALTICSLFSISYGQEGAPEEPTVEERVTRLERELAGLETRFDLRAAAAAQGRADGPPRGVTVSTRVEELERRVAELRMDLTRVERQAAAALREASQARRDAATAERIARQSALRGR